MTVLELRPPDLENLAGVETDRGHLSHSSLNTFLTCEQLWHLHYDRRLELNVKPEPLAVGAAFAHALEHADPNAGYKLLLDEHAAAKAEYEGNPWVVVPDLDEAIKQATIVRAASRAYLNRYEGRGEFREHEMRVRIRNPLTGRPSLTFDLLGRVDAISADGTAMVEDKFRGQIPNPVQLARALKLDRQVTIGCYLRWRTTGSAPEKVLYRTTRKPTIKQRQNETLDEYLERVDHDYVERPDFYLHEAEVTRTPEDFLRFEQELWRWAEQARSARTDGVYPRNTSACHDFSGCRFLPLCSREPGAEHLFHERPAREALQAA